ncbi:MAG: hypothetical protein Q9183_000095 [Haloplaca sp. 2 TL-2023]
MPESEESSDWAEEEAISDSETEQLRDGFPAPSSSQEHRKSSAYSRRSVEDPLLRRHASIRNDGNLFGHGGRISQKIYIVTEDMTIVVSGFVTSLTRNILYNQWGEFEVQKLAIEHYGHAISTVFGASEKNGYNEMDEDDDPVMSNLRFLDYRYMRFCFHPLKDNFQLSDTWEGSSWGDVKGMRVGLDSDERYRRELIFGKNEISIKQKSIPQLLVDEVSHTKTTIDPILRQRKAFHPFYVFQLCSLLLWSLDEYYYYATMRKLREISRFECDVRVIRSGFWRQASSTELVPGDVYEVSDPSLTQLPCDGLLLAGDCIVNESMLTGESVPVSKIPASNESLRVLNLGSNPIHPEVARNFLFGGTKIIRARRPQDGTDEEAVALAIVARTGFNTTKGALVRSMLFPKPSGFKFYKDAFRYISVMAAIAGLGFIASFVNFIRLKLEWHLIVVRALDLVTIVVPPALPATLAIGTNFAISRLRAKRIFCISPQRVNVGGKLDVVCFDKTGTLTEDGLDVLGVRVVHRPALR